MSINFFGFNILSKKFRSDDLIKDLALFWVKGAITAFKIKLSRTNQNESFIKKLMKSIFLIPKFQNITNSLLFSYLSKMYENAKNIENGKILLKIFGKLSRV